MPHRPASWDAPHARTGFPRSGGRGRRSLIRVESIRYCTVLYPYDKQMKALDHGSPMQDGWNGSLLQPSRGLVQLAARSRTPVLFCHGNLQYSANLSFSSSSAAILVWPFGYAALHGLGAASRHFTKWQRLHAKRAGSLAL